MEDFFEGLEDKNPDGSLNWGKSRKPKEDTLYVCTVCCGRELTKHTSIDLGIGPICKQKWGL